MNPLKWYCSLSVLLLITSKPGASELIACNPPAEFTYQVAGTRNTVRNIELTVDRDPGVTVYAYRGTNDAANVLFNELNINLKASLTSETGKNVETQDIRLAGTGRVLGSGEFKKVDGNHYRLLTPRLFLRLNSTVGSDAPIELKNQFLGFVRACVSSHACHDASNIRSDRIKFNLNLDTLIKGSVREFDLNSVNGEDVFPCTCAPTQKGFSNNNILVDAILLELSNHLAYRNLYSISLPDIDESFKTGKGIFSINGRFQARNGRFQDLTTLVRKADSLVMFEDTKLTIVAIIGLSTSNLFYDSYTFKYGFLKVGGSMWGSIDGMTIELVMTIDYSTEPCIGRIDYIKVSQPGKLKINITGLGILNGWVSRLITYVSSVWSAKMIPIIRDYVIQILSEMINMMNCQRYEKTLQMFT